MMSRRSPVLRNMPPAGLLGDEEDVHIGQDGLDRLAGLVLAPEVGAVVDVKGDGRAARLELLDELDGHRARVGAQRERDAAGVEDARVGVDLLRDLLQGDVVDGGIHAVIDDGGLARVRAALVVVDAKARAGRRVVEQVVVRDADKADAVLDVGAKVVGGELGNDARAQAQERDAGGDVEFRAAGALFKDLAAHHALVLRRGKAKHDLPKGHHVKRLFFHGKGSPLCSAALPVSVKGGDPYTVSLYSSRGRFVNENPFPAPGRGRL